MTPVQEMAATLFSKEVVERAIAQLKSGSQISPIQQYDMPFRLLKVDESTVNLEILINRPFGPTKQEANGFATRSMASYFKPIGVYDIKFLGYKNDITITPLREFEAASKRVILSGMADNYAFYTNTFNFIESAMIAAFSMDTIVEARAMKDASFVVNGLKLDLFMTYDNEYPQAFLDDSYGIEGPIAAYFMNGPTSLNPMIQYQDVFNKLYKKSLLSAYKSM